MPSTLAERNLLRAEFNVGADSHTDGYFDMLYDTAEADYVGYSRRVQTASVKLQTAISIRNRAATLVTTKVGERSEDLSDIAKAHKAIIDYYEKNLYDLIAIDGSGGIGRIAVMNKVPKREREYPD